MRGRVIERLVLAGIPILVLLAPGIASAQVQVTPNFSETPSTSVTPWVYQIAIATVILALIGAIGIGLAYLRFAPTFFGRREAPPKAAPGTRPALLTQPAVRPQAASTQAPSSRTATAPATGGGVAVAERPAPAPAPPEADASAQSTAGPMSEPAVQADAVGEAAAPEPGPSAKIAEEVGAPPDAAAPAEATAAEAVPAAPAPAVPAPASHGAQLDQETFDRVLEEQLAKGVDRRVAEGRARAAAVVAARKKAQA